MPSITAEVRLVRYGQDHKNSTRHRIVATAGRRLKRDGIDGSGVATLMKDAGLTNGAFYAHFASKEDLVATAIADQLRDQRALLATAEAGIPGLEQFVRAYLSTEHRDNPGDGCPSAALLAEVGRSAEPIKRAYTDGMTAIVDDLAVRLAPKDPGPVRVKILGVLAAMFGSLQLARAFVDPELSDAVLQQGIDNALALLGTDLRKGRPAARRSR